MQQIISKNKLFMSETRLVHYNDGNVVKFSHKNKYKNPSYINIALYSLFICLVVGEKPPIYFFHVGIFEI